MGNKSSGTAGRERPLWVKKHLEGGALRRHATGFLANTVIYLILISIVFLILYPLISQVSDMFKSRADLLDKSVVFIPKEPSLYVTQLAINGLDYVKSFLNTLKLSLTVAILQTLSCTVIGYGFARFKFPLRNLLFALVILTLLVPVQIVMPSFYVYFRNFDVFGIFQAVLGHPLNTIDHQFPFILLSVFGLGIKNGLYIFMLRQFFRGMPKELDEAGRIDGAGFLRIFGRIMLPNAVPIMITIFLFSFSWQWTDSFYSSIFFSDYQVLAQTLSSLTSYQSSYLDPVVRNAMMSAGIILCIAPLLLMYLFLQKFFIQGITRSGITG